MPEPINSRFPVAAIHELMVREVPTRYVERQPAKLRPYLSLQHYDEDDLICDYDRTYLTARPLPFVSEKVGRKVLGAMHRLSSDGIDQYVVGAFMPRVAEINERAKEFPIAFLNSHNPDLVAALTAMGEEVASARSHPGLYQKNLMDNIRNTHVVATRGFMPVRVGIPNTQINVRLVGAGRLLFSPHFTFPATDQMRSAGLPEDFVKAYNGLAKEQVVAANDQPLVHPDGIHRKWVMAPNAGPDIKGKDELEGVLITQKVVGATVKMLQHLGVGVVPIYTAFDMRNRPPCVELGTLIEPSNVNQGTIDRVAVDQAEFRRKHGENVYYAKEERVAA